MNISVKDDDGHCKLTQVLAGIMKYIEQITVFLNPVENSYKRFGVDKAPRYISWSSENRSQLIRIPAASGEYRRAELRSPDPKANPYLAYALLIYAGLYGIENNLSLPSAAEINFFKANKADVRKYKELPENLEEAKALALKSDFVNNHLPKEIIDIYCK